MTSWIQTSERLPNEYQRVLALDHDGHEIYILGWVENGKYYDPEDDYRPKSYFVKYVRCWQILPDTPEIEEAEKNQND